MLEALCARRADALGEAPELTELNIRAVSIDNTYRGLRRLYRTKGKGVTPIEGVGTQEQKLTRNQERSKQVAPFHSINKAVARAALLPCDVRAVKEPRPLAGNRRYVLGLHKRVQSRYGMDQPIWVPKEKLKDPLLSGSGEVVE